MLANTLAHTGARLMARQAPVAARRGLAVAAHEAPKHAMNAFPAMPVEVYPLALVVAFGSGFGIYSSVRAWRREQDAFVHHRSTGDKHMQY